MSFKVKDHYYDKAKKENFLARSVYKLEEIDKKFKILSKNNTVLDLGYHPGSWMQYTAKVIGPKGRAYGIDIKPVNKKLVALKNVSLYEHDINDLENYEFFGEEKPFDVVISDMAPNTTGIRSVDQDRSLLLVEMVFEKLPVLLKQGGDLVIKVFDSNGAQSFLRDQKKKFKAIHYLKPKSTRAVSKEFFVIGKSYVGE